MGADESKATLARERLSETQYETLKEKYKKMAKEAKSKKIDKATFKKYLFSKEPELTERLFEAFDADHDGTVDFVELATGVALCVKGYKDEKLQMIFKLFDVSNNGTVTKDEMKKMLSSAFFSSYLLSELRKVKSPSPATSNENQVEALFPYAAQQPDELTFEEHDVITVTQAEIFPGWGMGTLNGVSGLYPNNFVQSYKTEPKEQQVVAAQSIDTLVDRIVNNAFDKCDVNKDGSFNVMEFVKWGVSSYEVSLLLRKFENMEILDSGDFVISAPTGFKHVNVDENGRVKLAELPAEVQKMLKAAGVKKKEMQNPETAEFLLQLLSENLPPAPAPAAIPPPSVPLDLPLPPSISGPSVPTGPSGAPAPPPPPANLPPPPPLPPPSAQPSNPPPSLPAGSLPPPPAQGGKPSLLDQIKQGPKLKTVGERVDQLSDTQKSSMKNMLASAIESRRQFISREDENDNEEDAEWN